MFETKAIEVAVGQINGYIKPSEAERRAAYELFVELSTRTATVSVDDEKPSIRTMLADLSQISPLTREILRNNGADSAKGRADGNVSLAVIALRVVNEIIGPLLAKWLPLLDAYEGKRDETETPQNWERKWPDRSVCLHALSTMRVEVRSYMDTLARIAGAPSLSDLVDPPPASSPLPPTMLTTAPRFPDGATPRTAMVRWFDIAEGIRTTWAKHRSHANERTAVAPKAPDGTTQPPGPSGYRPEAPIEVDLDHDDRWNDDGEFWFDYVSDLGDGLDPTIAVAWQLTQSELTLPNDRSGTLPQQPAELPRGSLLVMGGDQIYPYASKERYRDQLILPYDVAAQANCEPDAQRPSLLAIPGNHDWYGGSEHFENIFIHDDEFASHWDTTAQTQRWWAIRLTPGWWMWGLDTGLDNTLDADQIAYFEQAASKLSDGDQVIVCTPVPLWQLRQKSQDRYFEIRAFLQKTIQEHGASTPLFLAGDSHFFAHYRRVDGVADEHHVTSGGGGAFLQPTHNLVEQVPFENGAPDFKLGGRWPRPVDSRALGANVGGLSDQQFRIIFLLLGGLFAAFAGLVSIGRTYDGSRRPSDAVRWVLGGWPGWPLLALLAFAAIQATVPNSKEPGLRKGARRYGAIHAAIQITGFVVVAALARMIVGDTNVLWHFVVAPMVGGVMATALMITIIRWINRRIRANDTLAYSSAHVTRYKHFVRMRITKAGQLTVYVVGLDPVGEHWSNAITGTRLAAQSSSRRSRRHNATETAPPWQRELVLPPFDSSGVPQIHYVWGKEFDVGGKEQLMERERDLGVDHPDTIISRSSRAKRLLDGPNPDHKDAEDPIALLERNVESCERTYTPQHPATIANRCALAAALIERYDPHLPLNGDESHNDEVLEQGLAYLAPVLQAKVPIFSATERFGDNDPVDPTETMGGESRSARAVALLVAVSPDGEQNLRGLLVDDETTGDAWASFAEPSVAATEAKLIEQIRALELFIHGSALPRPEGLTYTTRAFDAVTWFGSAVGLETDQLVLYTAPSSLLFEFGVLSAKAQQREIAQLCLDIAIGDDDVDQARTLRARSVLLFSAIDDQTTPSDAVGGDGFHDRQPELEALIQDCVAANATETAIEARFRLVDLLVSQSTTRFVARAVSDLLGQNIEAIEAIRPGVDIRILNSFELLARNEQDPDHQRHAAREAITAYTNALGLLDAVTLKFRQFAASLVVDHPSLHLKTLRELHDDCQQATDATSLLFGIRCDLVRALHHSSANRDEAGRMIDAMWEQAEDAPARRTTIEWCSQYGGREQLERMLDAQFRREPRGPDQFVRVHQASFGFIPLGHVDEDFQEFLFSDSTRFHGIDYAPDDIARARRNFARALLGQDEIDRATGLLDHSVALRGARLESAESEVSDSLEGGDSELTLLRNEIQLVARCVDFDRQLEVDTAGISTEWRQFLDEIRGENTRYLLELQRFAHGLARVGEAAMALQQQEELLRRLELGDDDDVLFATIRQVAELSLKCHDPERAIAMYRRLLTIPDEGTLTHHFDRFDGQPEYADIADIQLGLARAYFDADRLDEAATTGRTASALAARTRPHSQGREEFVMLRNKIRSAQDVDDRT